MYHPPDNLLTPATLDWVLDAIRYPIGGVHLFPDLAAKAAALAWFISRRHPFYSANKRTGFSCCVMMLRLNGWDLDVPEDEMVEVAVQVADAEDTGYTLDGLTDWVRRNMTEYESPDAGNLSTVIFRARPLSLTRPLTHPAKM